MNKFLLGDKNVDEIFSNSKYYELNDLMLLIPPTSKEYKNIYIPKRFLENVACHIIAPYLNNAKNYQPPIYLAINGSPGEGKTTQAIATCVQKGFYVIYVSASSLSGSHENEAKEKLHIIYNYAVQLKETEFVSIIIDDFHKGIINEDENIRKTINSNVLIGYMMNIAEHNGSIHIPIILTANDLSNVYAPLLRIGRANIFLWKPTTEERKSIVFYILSKFVSEENSKEFDKFYKKYQDESIAFFAQLENYWRMNKLKEQIDRIDTINELTISRINSFIDSYKIDISYETLNYIAESVLIERSKQ